ncbi:MAG: sigma-70 family RNA polymerase sigma factor [Woeseiaceae bacterium]|nr:sigma-70 family RNA polymerase sigma factor [Woeseiaceae bacterium]
MINELKLIEDAKAGSVTAFTDLVESYRVGLFRFLRTRCSNHADAEDALQDTLMSAYRYLDSYNPRWRFSTWLYRIAIRNAMRNRSSELTGGDEPVSTENDPLDWVIAQSERENLWAAAHRLFSDDVYAAMWLRYVEDMSIKDIARVLDHSVSWTKVNLSRGRKALDAELGQQQSEAYG